MREIHALERRSRDVVRASQVVPTLAAAVQEAIYNAVDAHAQSIKAWVDVTSGSFSVADDGDGIPGDGLYKYIGERVATSRVPSHDDECKIRDHYGQHGEFLHALGSVACVEIESRVKDQWTAHRKVIQEGTVVFNARSKVFHKSHGTTLTVHKLFSCLPVRAKDLQSNPRHVAKLIKEIQTFCVNLSMIWPTLSLELVFENSTRQSLRISGVTSCRERFVKMFGSAIGNDLEYVEFRPAGSQFTIRGYVALVQDSWEVSPAGLKQARAYYQYVFFQNQWIEIFHHECAKRITQLALDLEIGIPIFVLKIDCPCTDFALLWSESGKCVELTSPESLDQLLCELMHTLKENTSKTDATTFDHQYPPPLPAHDEPLNESGTLGETHWSEIEICQRPNDEMLASVQCCSYEESNETLCYAHDHEAPGALGLPPQLEESLVRDDLSFDAKLDQEQNADSFQHSHSHSHAYLEFPGYEEESESRFSGALQNNSRETETVFIIQDAKTNWGDPTRPRYSEEEGNEDSSYLHFDENAHLGTSCESCCHMSAWRGIAHNGDVRGYDEELEAEYNLDFSPSVKDSHEQAHVQEWIDGGPGCSSEEARQLQVSDVCEGELADVFFTESKVPKLVGDIQESLVNGEPGGRSQLWLTSRSLKSELDSALESLSPQLSPRTCQTLHIMTEAPTKKRLRQCHSKYFGGSVLLSPPPDGADNHQALKQPPRAFSLTLPRTSKCTLRVENVGELKQLRNFKIPRSVLKTLEVLRQVDRKFILVRVTTDESSLGGSLLLCIDQHAADERVRLERLELELFGPDGDELNIQVSTYTQPQLVLLNAKEAQTLTANEDIVRAWGFEFEFLKNEQTDARLFLYTSVEYQGRNSEYYVELRTTPKIDTRSANAEDFREFIQMLAQNAGYWSWTVMRPPVITRLLHSRACRSAIMFGDFLSVSQCRELVEDLRECKLPFQCAHGRPSVVPLVEFVRV